MIKVGIVGASGYTGNELIRLLAAHPHAQLECLVSRSLAGRSVAQEQPALAGWAVWQYEDLDPAALAQRCDVVFTAVPHGAAMELAPPILQAGGKFIDLGTDFRFRNTDVYEQWYKTKHTQADLSHKAAYGLPELFRESIKTAHVVGNPGCYPTATLLAVGPLAKNRLIAVNDIIVNAVSGVSGAGATPKAMYHFPNCTENTQAYGTTTHRHTPEMEQGVAALAGGEPARVLFTPHLVPMGRGILSTVVVKPLQSDWTTERLTELYQDFYQSEPFVLVLGTDQLPQTKAVWGSNYCHIAVRYDSRSRRIVIQSVIDNLVKGAAGQAIQNMNLLFGLDETTGLNHPGILP
ncbi:MAG TPA: N-acetyl-gamma-glutamyl-phosphate reductase [Firmicutes bacterium]|jgi:N-acetyl-gamma-glutamyl-phosphate reductase|nr:N-acetyl-gamma-glutamyl-phosphate reductase [Bacillota bacterium]